MYLATIANWGHYLVANWGHYLSTIANWGHYFSFSELRGFVVE